MTASLLDDAMARHIWASETLVDLAGGVDGEHETVEHGEGWTFHAPIGLRLGQVVHHGTDHGSQIFTALTGIGVEPPELDLCAYGAATGRTRAARA